MTRIIPPITLLLLATACGSQDPEPAQTAEPLTVKCEDSASAVPAGAWLCPAPETLECGHDATVYTLPPSGSSCGGVTLYATPQALPLGQHDVSVRVSGTDQEVCSSSLTVVDTAAPKIEDRGVELWPPNHKMRSLSVADCANIVDACDDDVKVSFTYATSDEPFEATGDGNTEPDIRMNGCGVVQLRAERSGQRDGRVYRLGVRAEDAAGNVTTGECHVSVPHDQSSAAVPSGAEETVAGCP